MVLLHQGSRTVIIERYATILGFLFNLLDIQNLDFFTITSLKFETVHNCFRKLRLLEDDESLPTILSDIS